MNDPEVKARVATPKQAAWCINCGQAVSMAPSTKWYHTITGAVECDGLLTPAPSPGAAVEPETVCGKPATATQHAYYQDGYAKGYADTQPTPSTAAPQYPDSSCAHPPWCNRWIPDGDHQTYHPDVACSCGVVTAAGATCMFCDSGLVFTGEEKAAIADLSTRQDLRPATVIKQALRVYQLHVLGTPELSKAQPVTTAGDVREAARRVIEYALSAAPYSDYRESCRCDEGLCRHWQEAVIDRIAALITEEREKADKTKWDLGVRVNELEWELRELREHDFGNLNASHPCSRCGVTIEDDHACYDCAAWLQRCVAELRTRAEQAEAEVAHLQEKLAENAQQYAVEFKAFENTRKYLAAAEARVKGLDALHLAVCDAVGLLNYVVHNQPESRQAHDILRQALVDHADAQPTSEKGGDA